MKIPDNVAITMVVIFDAFLFFVYIYEQRNESPKGDRVSIIKVLPNKKGIDIKSEFLRIDRIVFFMFFSELVNSIGFSPFV